MDAETLQQMSSSKGIRSLDTLSLLLVVLVMIR